MRSLRGSSDFQVKYFESEEKKKKKILHGGKAHRNIKMDSCPVVFTSHLYARFKKAIKTCQYLCSITRYIMLKLVIKVNHLWDLKKFHAFVHKKQSDG